MKNYIEKVDYDIINYIIKLSSNSLYAVALSHYEKTQKSFFPLYESIAKNVKSILYCMQDSLSEFVDLCKAESKHSNDDTLKLVFNKIHKYKKFENNPFDNIDISSKKF